MSYKIAVASSDGVNVDLTFGAAFEFIIYEVNGMDYSILEKRKFELPQNAISENDKTCSDGKGCGNGRGCSGGAFPKVDIVSDCRCIVCKKIGFNIQKQLEKLAITTFDVDCCIREALDKITAYINKIDNHQSLRGISKK